MKIKTTNKKAVKIHLAKEHIESLKIMALDSGFDTSRNAWLSHFIIKIALSDILFLDKNSKLLLSHLNLKIENGK